MKRQQQATRKRKWRTLDTRTTFQDHRMLMEYPILVLTSVRAAEAFNRADAILELDMLSEVDRHRMFVAGFRKIKPDPGQLEATFEQMLEQDIQLSTTPSGSNGASAVATS